MRRTSLLSLAKKMAKNSAKKSKRRTTAQLNNNNNSSDMSRYSPSNSAGCCVYVFVLIGLSILKVMN